MLDFLLLIVDFQPRLMSAIDGGVTAIRNTKGLIGMATLVDVPHLPNRTRADRREIPCCPIMAAILWSRRHAYTHVHAIAAPARSPLSITPSNH
jgi:hypothetical protein